MPEKQLSDTRSEEHTSELQSVRHLVCRLLLEKKRNPPPRSAPRLTRSTSVLPGPAPAVCPSALSFHWSSECKRVAPPAAGRFFFFLMMGPPPKFPLFPYPTPFR